MFSSQVSLIIVAIALTGIAENLADIHGIPKRQITNPWFNATTDTIFYLFTPKNKETPQIIKLNDKATLSTSNCNKFNPTRIIIHGWLSDVNSTVNVLLRKAYFQRGLFNIISVDWSKGSMNLDYPGAKSDTVQVGEVVADFINFLCENSAISIGSVYLIGHSLGAHISGITGKCMKNKFKKTIPTIFGLDPALPGYNIYDSNTRLDSTDADYVETIQTNCGVTGFVKPIGQASFYPNWGGPVQPGCILKLDPVCSHSRSYEYLAESINTNVGFVGRKCANYNEITRPLLKKCTKSGDYALLGGEPSRPGQMGVFYLPTKSGSPYASGQF